MNITSHSDLTNHAINCGIESAKADSLAKKIIEAIQSYQENVKKGAYEPNIDLASCEKTSLETFELQDNVPYGQKIIQQKTQRRIKTLSYPVPKVGRPSNPAVKVLISALATSFTYAGGKVTLNQEGSSISNFHSFVEPICKSLKLHNVRDYISDHMASRNL